MLAAVNLVKLDIFYKLLRSTGRMHQAHCVCVWIHSVEGEFYIRRNFA